MMTVPVPVAVAIPVAVPFPLPTTAAVVRWWIVAVTARGERLTLSPHLVGVSRSTLGKSFVRPLWSGDSARARGLFLRLNRGRTDPIVELRAEGERYSVSDTGLAKEALPTITYRLTVSSPR